MKRHFSSGFDLNRYNEPILYATRTEKTRLFSKMFSKLRFPSVTLVEPLVDKLAEVEVESLGVKRIRVDAETLIEKPNSRRRIRNGTSQ